MAICSGFYAFGYAFEIMNGDPSWTFLWLRVEYLGLAFIPSCWLWLALEYTGKGKHVKPSFLMLIFGVSALTLAAILTNNAHNLFYSFIGINNSGPFPTADLGKGVLYTTHSAWLSFCLVISAVIYIMHYFSTATIFKNQALIMVFGGIGAALDYFVYLFGFIPWGLDTGPIIVTINGFIFAFGIFQNGLLDVSPVARDKVFESMKEGVIVTDLSDSVVDFNPAAGNVFSSLTREWIGKNIWQILPQLKSYANNRKAKPYKIQNSDGIEYYEIRRVPVMVKLDKQIGTAWYMRQITEQHRLLEKLKNYAEKDALTGIWNRRKWLEMAKREIARAKRYKRSSAFMLLDIDHFKVINDTMGHETGDKVLKCITKTILDEIRECDIFGRVGGEEFAIILPETNYEKASIVSKRLLKAISNNKIDYGSKKHTVTISIGIVVCENGSIPSLEELLRRADNALYDAKKSGRNRVCFSEV